MKKQILTGFLAIITAMFVNPALTQEIISVTPSSGFAGETAYPVIVCNNTQLVSDFDYIEIGDPTLIQVLSAEVKNNFELEVIIDISSLAPPDELQDITIYLNDGSSIQKENAFLTKATGDFEVMLTVIHVDPLYLSAFDPDVPQNSPLLFTVQLMNEWKDLENVSVEFIVENPDYGELGRANKLYDTGIPKGLPYLVFDNRDFDEYEINSGALELLDEAMQSGLLPAGVYNYYINVYAGDSLIGEDQGANVTTNMLTAIDLIGPGSSLDMSPETVFTPTPYFQWFSAASAYDFALYEVMEGQTSPDEITSNLPEFEVTSLGITELLYPAYAELLVEGKTYAWQVKAYFDGSMGQEVIFSDVFWFQYQSGDGNPEIDHIEVGPEGSIVQINGSSEYSALSYNYMNIPTQIEPEWTVVPSSAGTIDENGLFTAGITLYGGDHATLASNVTASTGGEITSYYNLNISSDYGSSGQVSVHIVIHEEDLSGGEFGFYIRKDNYSQTDVFQWHSGDSGVFDDYIMLDYSEPYIVQAYLTYGFFEQESSFDFGITQSMQMTAEETPVPIPGAVWLLGSGLFGLVAIRRRKT